jgi:putative glutamine transport system substrate-binding protein
MKPFTSLVLILFLISGSLLAQKYTGDSWATVNEKGSGTLSVVYYPQAGLIEEDGGKMTGMCVDVLNEFVNFVQTKYGKKVTINYAGAEPVFAEFMKVCQTTPNILGVTNVAVTEERKKIMKFTPGFLSNEETFITHKDAPTISSNKDLAQLKGYTAKAITGSVHVKYIEQLKKDIPGLTITYGPSGSEILKDIAKDPKLFTILDFTEYVDATRNKMPVKKQSIQIATQELAFAMAKQTDWDKVWNEFLTPEFRKSEKYRKMIANNLGGVYLSLLK